MNTFLYQAVALLSLQLTLAGFINFVAIDYSFQFLDLNVSSNWKNANSEIKGGKDILSLFYPSDYGKRYMYMSCIK